MAKKPTKKIPQASKKTRDAIAMFKGKKSAVDLLEDEPKGKKLHLSPSAGKPPRKPLFEGAFKWIEGTGHYFVLAAATAVICGIIYWMMVQ